MLLVVGLLPALPVGADGVVDQQVDGDPTTCNAGDFPGTVPLTAPPPDGVLRQSFTPSRAGLRAVDLCLEGLAVIQDLEVTIRHGDVFDNGDVVGRGTAKVPPGMSFVHVDLGPEGFVVATTPGERYTIELPFLPDRFRWRLTCQPDLSGECPESATDRYRRGSTNTAAENADFGFRSLPEHGADLTGEVSGKPVMCAGQEVSAVVRNSGQTAVGPFKVELFLGDSDEPFATDRVDKNGLAGGSHLELFKDDEDEPAVIPADAPTNARAELRLEIDVDEEVVESDEINNTAIFATTITACEDAEVSNLTVAVDGTTVEPGLSELPITSIPPTAVAAALDTLRGVPLQSTSLNATPLQSTPLQSTPLQSTPLQSTPLQSTPLQSTPLQSTPLADVLGAVPEKILAAIPLTAVPVAPPTWQERLNTTEPIQSITLAQVLALDPPLDLDLADVGLASVLRLTWLSVAAATTPLAAITLPDGQDWCTFLAPTLECTDQDLTTWTLVTIDALGFPMQDLPPLPLSGIDFEASSPLVSASLSGNARFRVSLTALGSLAAEDALADPGAVLKDDFDLSRTLAEAEEEGAFRTGATSGDLLAALKSDKQADQTLDDSVFGLFSLADVNWGRFDFDVLDVPSLVACDTVTYTVSASSTGGAPLVDPTVELTLPPGFNRLPGSAAVSIDGVAPVAIGDPTITRDPDGRRKLAFEVEAIVHESLSVDVAACAGLTLGLFPASAAVTAVDAVDGEVDSPSLATDPPLVQVVEPGEPDDADAPPRLPPDTLRLGWVDQGDDEDWYAVDVGEPGTLARLRLSPPQGTDLDLITFNPKSAPLQSTPLQSTPLQSTPLQSTPLFPVGDSGASVEDTSGSAPPETLQDIPLQSTPLQSTGVRAVSTLRGDRDETILIRTGRGEEGHYTVQVSSYGSDSSPGPYVIQSASLTPPSHPALGECGPPPRPFENSADPPGGPLDPLPRGTLPETISSDTTTLFVVQQQAFGATYGSDAADALADLTSFVSWLGSSEEGGGAHLGIRAAILPVDGADAVFNAYHDPTTGWEANWCDPAAANAVVDAIRDVVTNYRLQAPGIAHAVIVGSDEVLPMRRVVDETVLANETEYTGGVLAATGQNGALVSAFAEATFLSDDSYGAALPVPTLGSPLWLSALAIGRLVETPGQVQVQIAQFQLSDGTLDPASAVVGGYDFLTDGAEATADALDTHLGASSVDRLISDTWTADDLRAIFPDASPVPDIAAPNGHADHFRLLSAAGDAAGDESDVLVPDDLAALPPGRVVFSAGCHFGTNVPDVLNLTPTADQLTRLDDWADALSDVQAITVANTGFGYGDTAAVALSERLMARFAHHLDSTPTVGDALRQAKIDYLATMGYYGVYDAKVLQEATFYGLPIYRVANATAPPPPPDPTPVVTDPQIEAVGGASLGAVEFAVGPLEVVDDPAGSCPSGACLRAVGTKKIGGYYDVVGSEIEGEPLVVHGYPVIPQATLEFNVEGGSLAGVLITHLESVERTGVDPAFARAVLDLSSSEPEPEVLDVSWPTAPARAVNLSDRQFVDLRLGGFRATGLDEAGHVVGDLRLDTVVAGLAYLDGDADDDTPPQIASVDLHRVGDTVSVLARAEDPETGTVRGLVHLRDSTGAWRTAELGPSGFAENAGPDVWTGVVALPATMEVSEVILAIVNADGGVGYHQNKGLAPVVGGDLEDGLTISVEGELHPSGWFLGPATVTVAGDPGVGFVYSLDGGPTTRFTGPVPVSGTGVHRFEVRGSDRSFGVAAIPIDVSEPDVVILSPADGAVFANGAEVVVDYRCVDAGSGIASCDGRQAVGTVLDTTRVGTFTFGVTATDRVGNTRTRSVSYTVLSRYTFDGFFAPIGNPPEVNAANAGETLPFKFRVFQDGVEVTRTSVVESATWQELTSCTAPFEPVGSENPATSKPLFRYSLDGDQFIFNAQTDKAWAGTCRRFTITLDDGSRHDALVRFS